MSRFADGSHLPGMTDEQMRGFRDALEQTESSLKENLWRRDGIDVQRSADPADEAQLALEQELNGRALDRDCLLLAAVRAALRRIEQGEYGVCQGCDGEISDKRLAAAPWAPYCIRCQEGKERKERTGERPEMYAVWAAEDVA